MKRIHSQPTKGTDTDTDTGKVKVVKVQEHTLKVQDEASTMEPHASESFALYVKDLSNQTPN